MKVGVGEWASIHQVRLDAIRPSDRRQDWHDFVSLRLERVRMPSRVTTRGLFWTGVVCVIALTVVRDFGVLAIVASLALRVLEQNSGTSRVITPVNESSDRH